MNFQFVLSMLVRAYPFIPPYFNDIIMTNIIYTIMSLEIKMRMSGKKSLAN